MKYDIDQLPLGSVARARAQLQALDLIKALKTCRNGHVDPKTLQPEVDTCLQTLYDRKAYGVILSGYYAAGVIGKYTVSELLRMMLKAHDIPSFLKQAYRFDALREFGDDIEKAICWHEDRRLPDALAWRRKFAKLREQETLRRIDPSKTSEPVSIEEETADTSNAQPAQLQLRPIPVTAHRPRSLTPESVNDPYIISQTARVKLEQAQTHHHNALEVLGTFLRERGFSVAASKLIDTYSVLTSGPAIFEVKSITEENEREQVRHALSQLYEYRFLHSLSEASLWVVFASPPFSQWYVDYLTRDRGINVIWLDNGTFKGPSAGDLR